MLSVYYTSLIGVIPVARGNYYSVQRIMTGNARKIVEGEN
jgi:hypothetical protein